MAALDLETHFGRPDIKVFEIYEFDKSYIRLFYRSTGSGNVKKFDGKFTGLIVPFYGMEDNADKTLIKGIMKRRNVHGARTLFEWQLHLISHLKDIGVDSDTLEETLTLLDTYFNTPTELSISIELSGKYWNKNKAHTYITDFLLEQADITPESYKDITDTYHTFNDTYELHNTDVSNLKLNWKKALQVLTSKQQEERLTAKLTRVSKAGIAKKGKRAKKSKRAKKGKRAKKSTRAKKSKRAKKRLYF